MNKYTVAFHIKKKMVFFLPSLKFKLIYFHYISFMDADSFFCEKFYKCFAICLSIDKICVDCSKSSKSLNLAIPKISLLLQISALSLS